MSFNLLFCCGVTEKMDSVILRKCQCTTADIRQLTNGASRFKIVMNSYFKCNAEFIKM